MSQVSWQTLEGDVWDHLRLTQRAFRTFAMRCSDDETIDVLHAECDAADARAKLALCAEYRLDAAAPSAHLIALFHAASDRAFLNAIALAALFRAEGGTGESFYAAAEALS